MGPPGGDERQDELAARGVIVMDITPEVSLHECLYAMGDVALAQADAEFQGDRKRAFECVLALISKKWAVLMRRAADTVAPVHFERVRFELHQPENWIGFDEATTPCFLRATDAGVKAFVTETNFFDALSKKRMPVSRPPIKKRGKKRKNPK